MPAGVTVSARPADTRAPRKRAEGNAKGLPLSRTHLFGHSRLKEDRAGVCNKDECFLGKVEIRQNHDFALKRFSFFFF